MAARPGDDSFTSADIRYAIDTAYLLELAHTRGTAALFAQVRIRMDGLGLTPKGKRYLRWRVAEPAEVVRLSAARSPRRRNRLSAAPDTASGGRAAR